MAELRDRPSNAVVRRPFRCLLVLCASAVFLLNVGCTPSGDQRRDRRPDTYSFWPVFPAEPRVQFLVSYQFTDDVEPVRSGLDDILYGETRRAIPINKPYGVEMWNGKIYLCDTQTGGVIILDLRKQESRLLAVSGRGRAQSPTDVAIAPDGMTYITDAARGVILVFDGRERYINTFGYQGFRPTGIAVHGDELFVCDFVEQKVQVFDRHSGEKVRAFGGPGDQDGQFVRPLGIGVNDEGIVYVSDIIQARVQKFSTDGTFLGSFGEPGDAIGTFNKPKHLAVDEDGIVYVVDAAFANVQMFNDEDALLMFMGAAGAHPGSMKLPAGVTVHEGDLDLFEDYVHPSFDAQRLILVTNQFGRNKVSLYALGQLKEGHTVQELAARSDMTGGMIEEGEDLNRTVPPLNIPEDGEPLSDEDLPDRGDERAP